MIVKNPDKINQVEAKSNFEALKFSYTKCCADVEWNGMKVRFCGELGMDGFAARAETMKWVYPDADKPATKQEQDEWVQRIQDYYASLQSEASHSWFHRKEHQDKLFFLTDEEWN